MATKVRSSPGRAAYLEFRKAAKLLGIPSEPWSKCNETIQLLWHVMAEAARKWEA